MHLLDNWYDFFRLGVLFTSLWCCYTLVQRYRHNSDKWTNKTKDYWYSMLMWSFVGITVPIQGILMDAPFTPLLSITTAAVLVTSSGLRRKGSWGGDN